MKSYLCGVFICALFYAASAQAQKTTDPDLARILGKVFLILSEEYIVSGQGNGQPSLWANARLGWVAYQEQVEAEHQERSATKNLCP